MCIRGEQIRLEFINPTKTTPLKFELNNLGLLYEYQYESTFSTKRNSLYFLI